METDLGVDGQSDPRKNCRVWGQMPSTACGCTDFWGEESLPASLPACLYLIELDRETTLSWMDYFHNPELTEGGNGAGALPATFTEKSAGYEGYL